MDGADKRVYVCGKKVKQDEPKIISEFIKSYKENFKQSFLITGILAILWYGTLTYFMMSFSALKEGFNGSVVVMLVLAFEVVMMSDLNDAQSQLHQNN